MALLLVSCGKGAAGDGHDHEDELQISGYSDDFEVYAQATPFASGQESEITAHFSHIPGFRPLAKGKVTVTLAVGNEGVRQTLAAPSPEGIYKFELTPRKTGEAKLVFDISSDGGTSRIVIDGLKVYADRDEAEHAAAAAVANSSNGVVFTKEMSWKVNFSTEPASPRPMGQVIRTMAQVQPSQGDVRTVTAKSSGVLTFASADLTDGRAVSAGQTLFRIDGGGLAEGNLRVRFLEAKNNYEAAKREYELKSQLAKEKLATESELLRARQEYDNARALYESLRGSFAAGASSAQSPMSGYLTQLLVTNGQYVEAGQPLATVAQNRDLFIKAEVQPGYYADLASITGATIRRLNSDDTYTLGDLRGSVVSYGRSVDAANPLLPVVFRVNNAAGLLPGSFVEMYIQTGGDTERLTVPTRSLIEEMGNYFVYVQLTPEYFEKREVKTGSEDGRYTEILSGVKEGERVVADGAVLVKLAHSSGSLDAHSGHVH